ncbi:4-methyl-5(B-hydroxyethyl)-thiazole monophosphate biosynthesis protein [Achromatium sp. WMS3]|nr:4-methyl-5(B-hydroxyethyl)-thiazole monophosphate biosynthesis protein [Achromatium sp. WMS3]
MARVLIPLAQGCEELEAVTIIDLLRRAKIEVITAGLQEGPVTASHGTVLVPDTTLDNVLDQQFDLLVLPGGIPGADNLNQDPRIHNLLKKMVANGKYTAAICAAPKVLADAGLLDGRNATCYPGVLDTFSQINLTQDAVVTDNKIITSRGPGTAMDFALTLIEVLLGSAMHKTIETQLQRNNN